MARTKASINRKVVKATQVHLVHRHLIYPTCPDVRLKRLPFYDVMATLLKPSSLQPTGSARFQEQTFSFHLTPQQVSAIEQSGYRDAMGRPDYKKQIQVRFSLLETSCEQADNFPSSVCVKVRPPESTRSVFRILFSICFLSCIYLHYRSTVDCSRCPTQSLPISLVWNRSVPPRPLT